MAGQSKALACDHEGEWTDDTALALATAEAYADGPCIDPEQAARAMLRWLASGPKTVGNLILCTS